MKMRRVLFVAAALLAALSSGSTLEVGVDVHGDIDTLSSTSVSIVLIGATGSLARKYLVQVRG